MAFFYAFVVLAVSSGVSPDEAARACDRYYTWVAELVFSWALIGVLLACFSLVLAVKRNGRSGTGDHGKLDEEDGGAVGRMAAKGWPSMKGEKSVKATPRNGTA